MKIPGDKEIRALHEKHAPSQEAFELVYTHCEIVCDIAGQLLSRSAPGLQAELVRAGSLLHDIGVYRLYDADGQLDHSRYIQHGVLGQELLSAEGLAEAIARFCSHHTGVGLSREDIRRQGLPLPVADYLAESDEEYLVMYADKFHSKTTPPAFVTAGSYAASVRRFGEDKVTAFAAMRNRFGTPDLAPLLARYGHGLKTGGSPELPHAAGASEQDNPSNASVCVMQKWEYVTVPLLSHATKQILDNWGDEGYELVSVIPGPNPEQLVAYMKRPKS